MTPKLKRIITVFILQNIFAILPFDGGWEKVYAQDYTPTIENMKSREEFSSDKFGIFLHWGIYSTYAQGEWYLQNRVPDRYEYAKAADAFYPHRFNAREWVKDIKAAGAKYICFTTRHHDGFSMWNTDQSQYNISDATPFRRDVLKELSDACHEEGIRLHLYYSLLDWGRDDYPMGRTGRHCGKDSLKSDWPHYYQFMKNQLTELLTNYGEIGAIWFDGWWDHDEDSIPFDWQLSELYGLIHRLQPGCLVGNNHHMAVNPGEDIQIFERDLPGENTAGFVDKAAQVSRLPLETCETMNGMWGYKVTDTNYKSTGEIICLLVNTAGKGANLLMNIGPQPNGELPAVSRERLKEVGEWMKVYGSTLYKTTAGPVKPCEWGATTQRGDTVYVHVLSSNKRVGTQSQATPNIEGNNIITIPLEKKPKCVTDFLTCKKVAYSYKNKELVIAMPEKLSFPDNVVVVKVK